MRFVLIFTDRIRGISTGIVCREYTRIFSKQPVRRLLLMLHRVGEIKLPAVRQISLNPFLERNRPQPVLIDRTPLVGALT